MMNMSRSSSKTLAIIAMTAILLFSPLVSAPETAYESNQGAELDAEHSTASQVHVITRRQAIIDYVMALYCEEDGAFYGYLGATPTDPRIGSCPDIFHVSDPYSILKRLNATGVLDWNKCREFLKSLVNVDSDMPDYSNLVNFSRNGSPCVIACDVAVQLFPELGLDEWLYTDEIAQYIARTQTSSGGFRLHAFNTDPPEMITTWSALRALHSIGHLSMVDTTAALSYIMSCYCDNGGFSNVPAFEALPGVVPLGLFTLQILGRTDLIRTENTTAYLLQYWDNSTGHVPGGTLVDTERLVWSLYTLGTLDRIDMDKTLSWVLASQTDRNGAFLPIPHYGIQSERLEWTRAATHILELADQMGLLDENITVIEYPEYVIPQWYIDYINEHFGTTTANPPFPFVLPNIDVVGILVDIAPVMAIVFLVALPGLYIVWSERMKRAERRQLRKRRKNRRSQ